MARPLRIQFPGAFYHVTSRGNERKDIFRSHADREKFLGYLESASIRYGAVIHAYCLMSNHYHLLLETPAGNLSKIMRHINGAYTTYFNAKRKRAGHLFQGRYKAILVEADAYAAELSRYLHLNPVRAGMVKAPQDYPWSSYPAYIGLTHPVPWLKIDFVRSLLTADQRIAATRYREYVQAAGDASGESPLDAAVASAILGGEGFVQRALDIAREQGAAAALLPKSLAPGKERGIEEVLDVVRTRWAGSKRLARKVAIFLCHRLTGAPLKQIGEYFGLKESAVAQASRRFAHNLENDQALAAHVAELEQALAGEAKGGENGRLIQAAAELGGSAAGEVKGLKTSINLVLGSFPEVHFCTLFGSAAKGRMTAHSDVDLAVAGEQVLPLEARARLSLALSEALKREVDLVDLQAVSGLILEQALGNALVVKNAQPALYARLLKRLWYNQSDMMPYVRRILEQRSNNWLR